MDRDMERAPEKYMDMITGEFAYDPVRLPVDQDSTQTLYNRKTLERIWETAHVARNPYTRQWFNIRYAIAQTELRKEMEEYINLQNFLINTYEEIDVIPDYTKILDEGEMKQLLEMLRTSVISNRFTTRNWFWEMICKKINLIRLYCQSHVQNIQTFRNLNGYTYFRELAMCMHVQLILGSNLDVRRKAASIMDICKEIVRIFDMIGLTSSDIVGENSMGSDAIQRLINILRFVYFYNCGFVKIGTIVLRLYCKIFDALAAETVNVLGRQNYLKALESVGPVRAAMDKLTVTNGAMNILSEDLNHGITILRRTFLIKASINIHRYPKSLVNALILCMSREIEKSDERAVSEGQIREAQTERRHNSEALEKGLRLINDIFSGGRTLADILQDLQIVKNIVDMLKLHLTFVCEKEGCIKFAGCVHTRIVILVLEILQTVWERGGALFGIDPLRIFSEMVERATSNNPEFRIEDLVDNLNLSSPFCQFFISPFFSQRPRN